VFPVTVLNDVDGVIGVIAVSGLEVTDDHAVIVDGITEYLCEEILSNFH